MSAMLLQNQSTGQKGFSLLTVTLLLALATVSFAVLLRTLEVEQESVRIVRLSREAAHVADNGIHEVLADRDIELPTDNTELDYAEDESSPLMGAYGQTYDAKIRLLRADPVKETSMTSLQALVFEVTATGRAAHGDATADYAVEGYRVVGFAAGIVLPPVHFR